MTGQKRLAAEALFWAGMLAAAWWWPERLPLLTHMLVMGLFAVSLDMLLGYAGILTVGHAAFYGLGAYGAGLLAAHGWGEPLSGLVVAGGIGLAAGYGLSFLLVRTGDLGRLVITIAVCLLLAKAARQLSWLTGGTDGLQGVVMWPVLGVFSWDLFGRTAFGYTLAVTFAGFLFMRRVLRSPLGLALEGIQHNVIRMAAIGAPVARHLRVACALSAAMAAVAGALMAQTTQFVGVDALSFERSAEVLIILVLGGTGRLYGGLVGAVVYLLLHDQFSGASPQYWMLGIGAVLMAVALGARGGILGLVGHFRPQKAAS